MVDYTKRPPKAAEQLAQFRRPGGSVEVATWQDAERLAEWHMRRLGFRDAHVTPDGADGGLDVSASGGVAQVKFMTEPIGSPSIQQLRGAAHGQATAIFYSLSGYTAAARDFADRSEVALFIFDAHGTVQAVNRSAERLLVASAVESALPGPPVNRPWSNTEPRTEEAVTAAAEAMQSRVDLFRQRLLTLMRLCHEHTMRPGKSLSKGYAKAEKVWKLVNRADKEVRRLANAGEVTLNEWDDHMTEWESRVAAAVEGINWLPPYEAIEPSVLLTMDRTTFGSAPGFVDSFG